MTKIQNNLSKLIALGASQHEIEAATGLHQSAISRLLNGKQLDASGRYCDAVANMLREAKRVLKNLNNG